jgi:hypothetical protein
VSPAADFATFRLYRGFDAGFAPGLYLVRLTQGANVRVTRVAVLK